MTVGDISMMSIEEPIEVIFYIFETFEPNQF